MYHVICLEGPEWCFPTLIVEGSARKAQKVADEMNSNPAAKLGMHSQHLKGMSNLTELSRFVVKKNIRKVTV